MRPRQDRARRQQLDRSAIASAGGFPRNHRSRTEFTWPHVGGQLRVRSPSVPALCDVTLPEHNRIKVALNTEAACRLAQTMLAIDTLWPSEDWLGGLTTEVIVAWLTSWPGASLPPSAVSRQSRHAGTKSWREIGESGNKHTPAGEQLDLELRPYFPLGRFETYPWDENGLTASAWFPSRGLMILHRPPHRERLDVQMVNQRPREVRTTAELTVPEVLLELSIEQGAAALKIADKRGWRRSVGDVGEIEFELAARAVLGRGRRARTDSGLGFKQIGAVFDSTAWPPPGSAETMSPWQMTATVTVAVIRWLASAAASASAIP